MLDFNLYETSRNFISTVGTPVVYLSLITSILLFVCCVFKKWQKYSKALSIFLLSQMIFCFFLLMLFHFRIYQSIKLDGFNGPVSAMIPPWIESGKLFLWGLLIQSIIVIKRFESNSFHRTLLAVNSVFIAFIAVFSNPFSPIHPGFHSEVTQFMQQVNTGNSSYIAAAYQQMGGKLQYYYNTVYMWLHPPIMFLSYALFGVSFIGCVFMLFKRDNKTFDNVAYNYGKFAYLMLTVGILLGYPWAIEAWKSEPWWWSPKINMSIMTWLFYTAYLHGRLFLHKKGMWNTSAILGIAAFVLLILTYISTYTLPGAHSYG